MYETSENFCLNILNRHISCHYIPENASYSLYFEILTQSAEISGKYILTFLSVKDKG